LSDKYRTLFPFSFCLDTTASSAQVQKNEKIKSWVACLSTPLDALIEYL
jgi:hypothetical protein